MTNEETATGEPKDNVLTATDIKFAVIMLREGFVK